MKYKIISITAVLIFHLNLIGQNITVPYTDEGVTTNKTISFPAFGETLVGSTSAEDFKTKAALAPPYIVIKIDIPPGEAWTDFELKASSNNFVDGNQVFYYHSPDPTKAVVSEQIWTNKPDVYYTDSGHTGNPNRRTWLKQGTGSIFGSLVDINSEVGGIIVIIKDDLRQYKNSLVFSYNLGDGSSWEMDAANRTIWRPTWPVEWVYEFNPN